MRARKQQIADAWEFEVGQELPELAGLARSAVIDHLPEFLDALAVWTEGDTRGARLGFEALADGHAVQRLGYRVDLRTLTREYALLRSVVLREMLQVESTVATRQSLVRLDEGLDDAMYESVRRYAENREQGRDLFIAILAHDLRTPLNAVAMGAGALQLALKGTEPVHAATAMILASTNRMGKMVSDLLDFARGHLGGGIPIRLTAEDMKQLVGLVVDELRIANPSREIRVEYRGDLRGPFDRVRVMQALSNLIANAIEHGRDPVHVSACEADDRRSIVTSVTSQGHVITPEELTSFFDPFRRARTKSDGLGLGLYIVGQIALAHGGQTDATSTVDGTTFKVMWPRARPEDMPHDGRVAR